MNATAFHDNFFSLSMRQIFNREVFNFQSDENENALHKFLRFTRQL